MTTHTLQQTLANAWHAHTRRIVSVSLGLLLLGVALATQHYAAPRIGIAPPASERRASSATTSPGWPGATLMGSAYDGQGDQAVHHPQLPGEFDYLGVLSHEQVRRYVAARPDRFQAYGFTRGPVLPDELNYLRVLSDAQVQRYIDVRQGMPTR